MDVHNSERPFMYSVVHHLRYEATLQRSMRRCNSFRVLLATPSVPKLGVNLSGILQGLAMYLENVFRYK